MGKNVSIFCESEISPKYYFFEDVKNYNKGDGLTSFDLLISVDVANSARLGKFEKEFLKHPNTLKIDHHQSAEDFAKENVVKLYSACAVLIYEILNDLKAKITSEVATRLLFGICGDTGIFRYSNTDSLTFEVASKLLSCGANLRFLYDEFFDKKTVPFVKMSSNCLANAELNEKFSYAVLIASKDDYKKFGLPQKNDNLSNISHSYLNCGFKIAVIKKEQDDAIHLSFRSKKDFDVSVIAEKFGGGGHKNAAAAEVKNAKIKTLLPAVRKEIESYLKSLD